MAEPRDTLTPPCRVGLGVVCPECGAEVASLRSGVKVERGCVRPFIEAKCKAGHVFVGERALTLIRGPQLVELQPEEKT